MHRWLIGTVVLAALGFLGWVSSGELIGQYARWSYNRENPDRPRVTIGGFSRLELGMSIDEATRILGTYLDVSEEQVGSTHTRRVEWYTEDGAGRVYATFRNGKLTERARAGALPF